MAKLLFLLACAVFLANCNPLEVMVPKTETVDTDITAASFVQRTTASGSEDFIVIENSEISIDREIEVYYSDYLLDDYWGMVIDVDILIAPAGGELLIYDNDHSYEGKTIRVIITWYEEEEIEIE